MQAEHYHAVDRSSGSGPQEARVVQEEGSGSLNGKFAVSYKEPAWKWEESPTEYFPTLEEARKFLDQAIRLNGRFRCFQLHEANEWVLLDEIDLGPEENSN